MKVRCNVEIIWEIRWMKCTAYSDMVRNKIVKDCLRFYIVFICQPIFLLFSALILEAYMPIWYTKNLISSPNPTEQHSLESYFQDNSNEW